MIRFLDLNSQYLSIKNEIDVAISETIACSTFIGGDLVRRFEQSFAAYQNVSHCVGVGNGTDAIEIGLEALELPRGSEVIVPANSFIASSEAVTRSGLKVVFADVRPGTYTVDPSDIERRLTSNTSAIIAVHLYGQPCEIHAILEIARANGLRVIEDAAQAHGAEINGQKIGGIADLGTFSFYPGKNLGAYGDGGAVVTNDEALARKCRMIANHGRMSKFDHEFEGRNSRLDSLQAAILEVKLRHLDAWIDRRNEIARRYRKELAGVGDISLPEIANEVRHSFHLFVIRTVHRDRLAEYLKSNEVQTGIHYPVALPKLRAYRYLGQADAPFVANSQDSQLLSLPMGEHLADQDVDRVIGLVKAFY